MVALLLALCSRNAEANNEYRLARRTARSDPPPHPDGVLDASQDLACIRTPPKSSPDPAHAAGPGSLSAPLAAIWQVLPEFDALQASILF